MVETATPNLRLAEAAKRIFGAKCKAAWLSGSFAYGGARAGHSDVDVVVVLAGIRAPADEDTIIRIKEFVDEYLVVHAQGGFQPDLEFPGEYLTEAIIQEATEGRGLTCDDVGRLALSAVDAEAYWIDRPDRWYRAWLGMSAFSRYLAGSRSYHSAVKLRAWKTVIRFIIHQADGRGMTLEEVLDQTAIFGVKQRYHGFCAEEATWVHRALQKLAAEGALRLENGHIIPDRSNLHIWGRQRCSRVAANSMPALLLGIEETRSLSRYASVRWAALT